MKIADLIYKTPEMTEEKLLTIIDKNKVMVSNYLIKRLNSSFIVLAEKLTKLPNLLIKTINQT